MTAEPEDDIVTPVKLTSDVEQVIMHPLVLLSAADHYHRVARGTRKRVVGVLLGQVTKGSVDVTNSFAVPFEEDSKNPAVFYLDHNFLESMLHMYRKVNAKERVVGFYSTGPQIRPNDLRIHDIVERFLPKGTLTPAVFCIIDIRPDRQDLPITSYRVVEELSGKHVHRSFAHVPVQMGALEAEEVGVEHLLRDINDPTISTVASLIKAKVAGMATLTEKLVECKDYLQAVAHGTVSPNHEIIANLQTILNLLPNLNTPDLVKSLIVKTNDLEMALYLAALIRSVIALHDLVNNKIRYGEDGTALLLKEEEEKKEEEQVKEEKKVDDAKQADNK
ncbi:26S proteasome regulatory subunit N8 [Fistulifera solaris]|uniref:26S proteasome regulatory subunit N8 n=1 Tax=Fistulifera solaris TaxID=1519565 RepID=A0A1Z5KBN4_FISSO|nr:26S proteasome regulatory subunit N8 [Fistulifera solaris]|eukprot:GAX23657.1 26S proteasome regulatory subunit N8 [Fistulifera solaris]